MKHKINMKFIQKMEGFSLTAYVPDPETSNSGTTILHGFDIGQCSEEEIKQMFSPNVILQMYPECDHDIAAMLLPYANIKKWDAVNLLEQRPLKISSSDAIIIGAIVKQHHTNLLIKRYGESFYELLECQQTVIASVAYQYGDLSIATPNFWRQVKNNQWQSAIKNLRDFKDRYPSRRNKEADYLEGLYHGD